MQSSPPNPQSFTSRSGSWPYKPCEGASCKGQGRPTFFCAHCDSSFCESCWGEALPHRPGKRGPDGLPHEQMDLRIVERLRGILEPSSDSEEQRALHKIDEDTTWFGIGKNASHDPIFQDYGRYVTIMADSLTADRDVRYPQLVSFIGQTGAGKSTLIKMLIDNQEMEMNPMSSPAYPSPVVGSVNDNVPTSGDVHLYADPGTIYKREPILFADCEGLEGGETLPIAKAGDANRHGAVVFRRGSRSGSDNRPSRRHRKVGHTSLRAIAWANTPEKRKREYAVRELYPRLLYTFSDVVVFVLRNSRTFESSVLTKLLSWAAASQESSLNQPALPHAIIVLNATKTSVDQAQWDVPTATEKLLADISGAIEREPQFQEHANLWRSRGKYITTMKDLLECYYSSVTVVRVPSGGRYMLMNKQVVKLHEEIQNKCKIAHGTKKRVRMLSNGDDLQNYLQSAFDHFSRNLDTPFNFVEVALKNNPIPLDFRGNILKLAIAIKDHPSKMLSGPKILEELSFMVASCVMLDIVRHRLMGDVEDLLKNTYMDYCDDALEDLCDLHWPCEFQNDRGQCQNFRSGHHPKGHQNSRGKILAVGDYVSSFTADAFADEWSDMLARNLKRMHQFTQESSSSIDAETTEEEAASKLHHRTMNEFYQRLAPAEHFISHSTCFCCLRELPEHALPCGHVFCTTCVRSYGSTREKKGLISMRSCPLHSFATQWKIPFLIKVKPALAGVRVLSLDGGGIRGIAELEVLQAIQLELPDKIPIQEFFDLIVGTSTGGIIALGLGVEKWSVSQCITNFTKLCEQAFTPREFHGVPILQQLTSISHENSLYRTRPFVDALKDSFEDEGLFGGPHDTESYFTKVAVTSTKDTGRQAVIFTNYNRPHHGTNEQDYIFERPDKPWEELKTWEAARATSAAPTYFKPFRNDRSGKGYIDGGLFHNNPVNVANMERKLLWPDVKTAKPDILLSIGTCCTAEAVESSKSSLTRPGPIGIQEVPKEKEQGKNFFRFPQVKLFDMMMNRFDTILDADSAWTRFQMEFSHSDPDDGTRFQRINPRLDYVRPALDETKKLVELKKDVRKRLRAPGYKDKFRRISYQLVASSFYFEKSPRLLKEAETTAVGQISCRFHNGSEYVRHLGAYLRNKSAPTFEPYFLIREKYHDVTSQEIKISMQVIERMINLAEFDMDLVRIPISGKLAITTIALCLTNASRDSFQISGFPRDLLLADALIASASSPEVQPQKRSITRQWRSRQERRHVSNISPFEIRSTKDKMMGNGRSIASRHSASYELADRLPRPYDRSALFREPQIELGKGQGPSEGRQMHESTESAGSRALVEETEVPTDHYPHYSPEDVFSVPKRKRAPETDAMFELP